MCLDDAGDDVKAHAHAAFFFRVKKLGASGECGFAKSGASIGEAKGKVFFFSY